MRMIVRRLLAAAALVSVTGCGQSDSFKNGYNTADSLFAGSPVEYAPGVQSEANPTPKTAAEVCGVLANVDAVNIMNPNEWTQGCEKAWNE